MKKALLLSAVLLVAMCSFADPAINNFTGYNDGWFPFGDPPNTTQTYGEVFTAPPGAYSHLYDFSFYTGDPYFSGDIIAGAYIATWTGTHAGELLYSSPQINYDNLGNEELNFFTGREGVRVTPGSQYVMFLSTTNYHGQSVGATFVSDGASNQYLDGFAFYNNGGDFNALFTSDWDISGLQPDWAVDLEFGDAPEPGSLILLGTGIVGGLAVLRRRLF